MTPPQFLEHGFWQSWALVLLHFLWQGATIAGLLALALRVLSPRTPRHRYALYLVALAAMIASPAATFVVVGYGPNQATAMQPAAEGTVASAVPVVAAEPKPSDRDREVMAEFRAGIAQPHERGAPGEPASATEPPPITWSARMLDWFVRFAPYIVAFWLVGVVIFSGRLGLGMLAVLRLRLTREPVSENLRLAASRLARRMGLRRCPDIASSRRLVESAAAGILRPTVYVPAGWLLALPPDVLEAVVAHELAHIRRWDLWVQVLERVVETVLFYHPAVWWVTAGLRGARELCCDELAVVATGRPAAYARALEWAASRRLAEKQPAMVLGIGGRKMAVLERVKRVLGLDDSARPSRWWPAGLAALVIGLLIWGGSAALRPALADDDEREEDRAVATDKDERVDAERGDRERDRDRRDRRREREGDDDRAERERRDRETAEGARERRRDPDRDRPTFRERERDQRERGDLRNLEREQLVEIIISMRRELESLRRQIRHRRDDDDRRERDDDARPERERDRPRLFRDRVRRFRADPGRPALDREGPQRERREREGGPRVESEPLEQEPLGVPFAGGRPGPEFLRLLQELREEVERLRQDVNELREGRRGPIGRRGFRGIRRRVQEGRRPDREEAERDGEGSDEREGGRRDREGERSESDRERELERAE